MTSSSRFLTFCAVAAAVATSTPARAASEADEVAAQALFDQGKRLMQQGDFEEGCEKLRASNELDPGVGTLLYLADCYERGNRIASAWRTFEDARTMAEERSDDRAKIAAVRAAALKPRLVYMIVEVQGEAPAGLEVRANGRLVVPDSFGTRLPVDEGPLVVGASAPGFEPVEVKLDVKGGVKTPYKAVIPELTPISKPAPAPVAEPKDPSPEPAPSTARDDPTRDPGSGQETVALIVGGVGAASLIVGGVFTALAAGNADDSEEECSEADPNACSVSGKALRDDALSQASIATVASIVGGVGLAAGVTLYFTAPSDDQAMTFGLGYEGQF